MTLPMFLVCVIFTSVTLIVILAARSHMREGESLGVRRLTFVAVVFWCLGMTIGFFVTRFSSPTLDTWWWALLFRVAWQIGGTIFLTTMILIEIRPSAMAALVTLFAALTVSAALNYSSLRDLIEGPQVLSGAVDLNVVRRSRVKGGGSIRASLKLTSPDGTRYQFDTAGWEANQTEDLLSGCENAREAKVTMLRHAERLLEARCQ